MKLEPRYRDGERFVWHHCVECKKRIRWALMHCYECDKWIRAKRHDLENKFERQDHRDQETAARLMRLEAGLVQEMRERVLH